MARQMSTGKCNLCGGTFGKAAMTKHLNSCRQAKAASATSERRGGQKKTKTFHLVVEGRYLPDYWMHLEVPADAKLEALDDFLRGIWLECCGHMSAFTIGDTSYSVAPTPEFDDKSMNVKLGQVLVPGMKFYHEYDFGTTTHLTLKVISEQESDIKSKDIQVLARNEPPPIVCVSCGKMATQVCTECLWSEKGNGWLCTACAAEHRCGEEMLLPVVNSPRVGMCGYTGD
jgi:hypothetical protein